MSLIKALREQYPEYEKYSDEEITSFLGAQSFTAEAEPEVAPVDEGRTWGEALSDTGASIMGGFANLGGDLAWMADKATGGAIDVGFIDAAERATDYWQNQKSDELKAAYSQLGAADGFIETLAAVADRPEIIPDVISGSLPYLLPTGVVGRAAKGAQAATAVAATGGLLEGSNAAREAESRVAGMTPEQLAEGSEQYRQMIASGMSEGDAKEVIREKTGLTAFGFTAPIAALAGKLTGAAKLEADFFTGKGIGGVARAGSVLAKEGAEEIIQEGSNALGGNLGVRENADASQSLGEGVGQAAALGLVAGAGQAAPMAALKGFVPPVQDPKPDFIEASNREIESARQMMAQAGGDTLDQTVAAGQAQAGATPAAVAQQNAQPASELSISESEIAPQQDMTVSEILQRQQELTRGRINTEGYGIMPTDEQVLTASTLNAQSPIQRQAEGRRAAIAESIRDREESYIPTISAADYVKAEELTAQAVRTPVPKRTPEQVQAQQTVKAVRAGQLKVSDMTADSYQRTAAPITANAETQLDIPAAAPETQFANISSEALPGERYRSVPVPETQDAQSEPVIRSQPQKPKGQMIDQRKDDLAAMISKHGGLNRAEAEAAGVDPQHFGERSKAFGNNQIFTNDGLTMDAMAEALEQEGMVQGADRLWQFEQMLHRQLGGERVYTPEGQAYQAQLLADEEAKMQEQRQPIEVDVSSDEVWISEAVEAAENAGVSFEEIDSIISREDDAVGAAVELRNAIERQTALQEGSSTEGTGSTQEIPFNETGNTTAEEVFGSEEPLLTSYTEQDLSDRDAQAQEAQSQQAESDRKAEQKAQADAERDSFALSGSDSEADVAISQGQKPLFMFAGETAAEANRYALDAAKQQVENGRSPEIVRRETGWHRGADGKWRFEIDDSGAMLKDPEEWNGGIRYLDELMSHPRLFAAYPFLRHVRVVERDDIDGGGIYFERKNQIHINSELDSEKRLSIMLHEVQHAIQKIENFARGGSSDKRFTDDVKDTIKQMVDGEKRRVESWKRINYELILEKEGAEKLARHASLYESVQRLVNYAHSDKPSGVLRHIKNESQWLYHQPFYKADRARELERRFYDLPKRHKMRERNAFLREYAMDLAAFLREQIPAETLEEFNNDPRQIKSMVSAFDRKASKARKGLNSLRELEMNASKAEALGESAQFKGPYDIYRALAGEVEARNTQARQKLTEEERRNTSVTSTEDVSRSAQIVINGDDSLSVPESYSLDSVIPAKVELHPVIDRVAPGLKDSGRIVVVADFNALPAAIKKQAHKQGSNGKDVNGVFHNGKIYLVNSNIRSEEQAETILMHEATHGGIDKLFEDEGVTRALNRLYAAMGGATGFNKIIDQMGIRDNLKGYIKGTVAKDATGKPKFTREQRNAILVHEMLAFVGEQGSKSVFLRVKEVIGAIRNWLRSNGFVKLANYNAQDIAYMAKESRDYALKGDLGSNDQPKFLAAWHGTPHNVHENGGFQNQYMGTGEGAQMFGWGQYFAGKREVAEWYRSQLAGRDGYYRNERIADMGLPTESAFLSVVHAAANYAKYHNDTKAVDHRSVKEMTVDYFREELEFWERQRDINKDEYPDAFKEEVEYRKEQLTEAESLDYDAIAHKQKGNLYKVDIPEDSELLDWDKPYSEQPGAVKAALRAQAESAPAIQAFIDGDLQQSTLSQLGDAFDFDGSTPGYTMAGSDLYTKLTAEADRQTFDREGPIWDMVKDDSQRLSYSLDQLASMYLNSLGIPGLRYLDGASRGGEGDYNYVIWDESVIDIHEVNDQPLFSRREDSAFEVPEEKWTHSSVAWIADKFNVLKRLQKNIKDAGGEITEASDAYLAEELFHGKAENDLRQMRETYVEPLAKKLAQFDITQAQLDEYLYALHAPERNAHIAEINPDMPDGGSGMTDQEAAEVLAKVKATGKTAEYDQVAAIVYDMLAARRDAMKRHGLEDDGLIGAWEAKYKHYVPLKGFAENESDLDPDTGMPRTGKGFTIGGKESKRAMGRSSEAASPSSYAIQDLTETLIRTRKNEVGNAFLEMVQANPNDSYWEVFTDDNPEMDRRIVKRKGEDGKVKEEVVEQAIPMAMMSDRYFTTKKDGKTYYIKLEDPRLMKAMKNIGPDSSNFVIRTMATVNRFLSSVNTSYNPEFVVGNFARDIQTAILNLSAEQSAADGKAKGEKIVAQVVKDVPAAMRSIYRSLRGKKPKSDEWAKYFDEFRADGAKTGYFDMKDIDGQAQDVQDLMAIAQGGVKGNALKWAKASGQLVEDINQSVENAVRLSAYVNARKAGISRKKAASLAKNMTVNFNRRGQAGTTLNALYMFANASIQGTMNFARTMGSLKGQPGDPVWKRLNTAQKISVGLMAGSYAIAAANRMGAGEDDDGENWYDKVPQYVKERNLVIMKSLLGGEQDGSYWKIPLPYGYNIFHVFGTSTEAVASGAVSPGRGAVDLALAGLGSFSPIGFQDSQTATGMVLRNLTPTIGKPIADIVANENFAASSIYNENFPFGTPKPDSSLGRRSTPEAYKVVASWLNEATGGSQWRSGAIDLNPDVMRYFVSYATGGAGNFVMNKMPDNVFRLANDVELPSSRTVFLSRLNGQVLPYDDQDKFYDRRDEINQAHAEYKALKGSEKLAFHKEYKGVLRLNSLKKATEKQLRALRKQRNYIYNLDLSPKAKDERLKVIEQKMKVVIDRFNKAYKQAN